MSNIPTLATVLDILAHEILVQLDLVDIQALSQCSTNLRTLVPPAGFVAHHRLKNVLEQYFDDVDKFKSVLREQNALVGGSTVLSLCRPSRAWVARDLDVVVEEVKVGGVEKFLKKEGYEMQDGKLLDDTYYSGPGGPTSALAFEWSRWTRGKRSIDVSVVARVTPVEYVLTYHTTTPMNFYDGVSIVVLFPRHTFAGRFLRNSFTTTTGQKLDDGIQKYIDRGYVPVKVKNKHGEEVDMTVQDEVWEAKPELRPQPNWCKGDVVEPDVDSAHTSQIKFDDLVHPPWVLKLQS